MNSDEAEKLRIISIQFQPSDLSAKLNLEFSNMVTTYNRRDDYTYLTGNGYSRSGKNKITAGISSDDLTTALSTPAEFQVCLIHILSGFSKCHGSKYSGRPRYL